MQLQRLSLMEDRERIAKELHDGVIQSLFAVGMGLQGTAMLAGDEDLARRIEGGVEELDRVIKDLRNYIFGLRPGILAGGRLDVALRQLAAEFGERTGVVTVAEVDPRAAAALAGRATDVCSWRARRSPTWAATPAPRPCASRSLLEGTPRSCSWTTTAVASIRADPPGQGQGLRNMRQRAEGLGAVADLSSIPGEGTTFAHRLPPLRRRSGVGSGAAR